MQTLLPDLNNANFILECIITTTITLHSASHLNDISYIQEIYHSACG